MKRAPSALIGVVVGLLLPLQSAVAQEAVSSPQCEPACRAGYVCVRGACVSACNPQCGPDERCGANLECLPKEPAKVAGEAAPPRGASSGSSETSTPAEAADVREGREAGARQGVSFGLGAGLGYSIGAGSGPISALRFDVEVALTSNWYLLVEAAPTGVVASRTMEFEGTSDKLTISALLVRGLVGYDTSAAFSLRAGPTLGLAVTAIDGVQCGPRTENGVVYGASAAPAVRFGATKAWEVALLTDLMVMPDARCTITTYGTPDTFGYEGGGELTGTASVGISYTWR